MVGSWDGMPVRRAGGDPWRTGVARGGGQMVVVGTGDLDGEEDELIDDGEGLKRSAP
jgi:hypothetical protein